ncbi:MAG: efflux RND transporter permease subunit [Myxococcota bacterium]|nr:efflux RND transporter permease subunit [Myxococcota bacterium]
MNPAEITIRKRTVSLVLTVILVIGGLISYDELGRLEDPEFTIKEALVVTPYPGATPGEVETEVTNAVAREIQRLGQVKRVESRSLRGLSIVRVTMKDIYGKAELPQVWDELRRKVGGAQSELPPGAGPSVVDDDFGDVYGVYVAITGEGYTESELKAYVDLLRRELLLVKDVKGIQLFGVQRRAVHLEMKRDRMAELGVSQDQIIEALAARNLAAAAGHARVGTSWVAIEPTGHTTSPEQIEQLLLEGVGGTSQIHLGDVASVTLAYVDPPESILRMSYKRARPEGEGLADADGSDPGHDVRRVDAAPAVGLAISTAEGGNVVAMGKALAERMDELEPLRPIGIELNVVAMQSDAVEKAVDGFVVNLVEAIVIVVVVLLCFMGLRAGLLIGFILFVTITATFIVMDGLGVMLERISLGALIIALGMLVDNAIVVTEGMQIRLERGDDPLETARQVVSQNQWPLLGATIVAVLAFGPIGLSQDDTGEFCRSLFQVLLTSLLMSWLTAVTLTPLLCVMLFRPKKADPGSGSAPSDDPYGGRFFALYRAMLEGAIRFRWVTISVVAGLFALSVAGFGLLPDGFFPASSRPQYTLDLWLPQGTFIRDTDAVAMRLAEQVLDRENTSAVATHVGAGAARFLLVYNPELPNPAYAQLIVNVADSERIPEDIREIEAWARDQLPGALVYGKRFKIGPGRGGNVQLRLSGPDPETLRDLAQEAARRMEADPLAKYVRLDWKEPVKVVRPVLEGAQARRNGIERPDVARQLEMAFQGSTVGVFRQGGGAGGPEDEDRVLPIVWRAPLGERARFESLFDLQIESPAAGRMIPLRQIVERFETDFQDDMIFRRNRRPTITLHADQLQGQTSQLWSSLSDRIEPWFAGLQAEGRIDSRYRIEWGGEHEDSNKAVSALAGNIPLFLVVMIFIVIALFNNLVQPLTIWLTVPLALIGVTAGLLVFDMPFNFMATLGTLALSGMLIKNAIVLIDETNSNESAGMKPYDAIVAAGVSRLRPVMMAAATTVLGMLPLLQDVFFVAMAVAVMFGLTFATGLTLIFVPVLSATLRRVPSPPLARG